MWIVGRPPWGGKVEMDPALICGHTLAARALGQMDFAEVLDTSDRGSKRVHFGVPPHFEPKITVTPNGIRTARVSSANQRAQVSSSEGA